jgi:hypothetical protein
VPVLDPVDDLVSFTDIAVATLHAFDLKPAWFEDEDLARRSVTTEMARGRYPVLVTSSDTSGEKEIEEFVAAGEQAWRLGWRPRAPSRGPLVDWPLAQRSPPRHRAGVSADRRASTSADLVGLLSGWSPSSRIKRPGPAWTGRCDGDARPQPTMQIPLCVPHFPGNERRYVLEALDSGFVSSVGPFVERFEREFAA